ncbi:MAG: restriction endonuclease subunit S [Arhodomonas sp.]|nr:restriction endonuclease subunit S [Arhodomonas sp.]
MHQSDYTENGVPVVMPKDIVGGRINENTVARVSESTARRLSRHALKPGAILIPRRGEIGKRALIREEQSGYLCGTGCLKVEVPENKLRPQFLYYYLCQGPVVEWIERQATGSTMLNLNTSTIGRLPVPLIGFSEQDRIVRALAPYDDLIENNRRRIRLLEESARLLYREWFVHLRFPGHEHVKVVDGVPEGWEPGSVPDSIEINPTERAPHTDRVKYVPMSALPETGPNISRSEIELREKATNTRFRNDDVLFARITPCLENGKTGFVDFLNEGEVGCGSSEFIILRAKRVSPMFTYCLARDRNFRETAKNSMIGSSGRQRVQRSALNDFSFAFAAQDST